MKVVYKYEFKPIIALPKRAEILTMQMQHGIPTLWALVDPENELEDRVIDVVGTGWEVKDNMKYICTYMDGPFVWHAFERLK